MNSRGLTEYDAAKAFADAWNRLDCTGFIELLSEDCCYASQYVFEELESKEQISDYLSGKIEAIKSSGKNLKAELGKISTPDPGRDCVLLFQGDFAEISAVVVFKVIDGKIKRYDLCMPEFFTLE